MSQSAVKFSKRLQWRLEWLLQVSLENLLRWLPGALVWKIGAWAGGLAWYLVPRRRLVVLRNLRIALGDTLDPKAIRRVARDAFRSTGANLFSAAHAAKLTPHQLRKILHLENLDVFEQARARSGGRGPILLLAHMSNWELLARLTHVFPQGTACGAFYRPLNNPLLDERTLRRRQADGVRMFSKHDGPHQAAAYLRAGATIGILSDQRTGLAGQVAPFFGHPTRCSPLPSLLSRRTRVELLALSLVTTAPGRWSGRFFPVAPGMTTGNAMNSLEDAMRAAPGEVFWFQDRWKLYTEPGTGLTGWLGSPDVRSPKPLRLLLWLENAPPDWRPAACWFHPDAVMEAVLPPGAPRPPWLPENARIHIASSEPYATLAAADSADPFPIDLGLCAVGPPRATRAAFRRAGIPWTVPATGASGSAVQA